MTVTQASESTLPGAVLDANRMPGHWLLARLGKRVLRPGGAEMTRFLLDSLAITSADDVVEIAPGLGATTRLVLERQPASYLGVDRDPDAAGLVGSLLDGPNRRVIEASVTDTGLDAASADVAFGEAYLTMHPDSLKERAIAELARVLRPGGRFALHEVAFRSDDIDPTDRASAMADLTSTIKVNVTPMTPGEWIELLDRHGLEVIAQREVPLHLLEPRRLLADEGVVGAARFIGNVLRDHDARGRVVAMRRAMRAHEAHLQAIGLVAVHRER